MAKASPKSTSEIQRLLAEKQRIEQWLERLNIAADKTPQPVRERVANDYRNRLEGVVAQLQSYQDELASALHAQLTRREELRTQEAKAAERLAEAELRHTVGEYNEARWGELRGDIMEALAQVRDGLKEVDGEIKMLEGVVALLEPGHGAVGAFGDEDEEPLVEAPPRGSSREAVPPAEVIEGERGQTDAFDELAFLKSVTTEKETPRAPTSPLQPAADNPERTLGAEGVKSVSAGERSPSRSSAKKTLKCVECGTMNLPTEWYCERCGAELAAL